MQFPILLLAFLSQSLLCQAGCKKDSCYNAIANNAAGAPALASRKSDCSKALKLIVNAGTKTVYQTVFSTSYNPVTVTATTATVFTSIPKKYRREAAVTASPAEQPAALDQRDKIVMQGSVPKYASACKNIQEYGSACMCYGIQPAAVVGSTVTSTITKTTVVATKTTLNVVATQQPCFRPFKCGGTSLDGDGCTRDSYYCWCVRTDKGPRCVSLHDFYYWACKTSADCNEGYVCTFDICGNNIQTGCSRVHTCANPAVPANVFRMVPEHARSTRSLPEAIPSVKHAQPVV